MNERNHTYVGITKGSSAEERLACHNSDKGAKRTRGQGPWSLVYLETGIANRSEAQRREWYLKRDRSFRNRLKKALASGQEQSAI